MSGDLDLLLRGASVHGRERRGPCDLAICAGTIEAIEVAGTIDPRSAKQVLDVETSYLAPALVDLGCGVARADAACVRGGIGSELAVTVGPDPSAIRRLRAIALPRADRVGATRFGGNEVAFAASGRGGANGEGLAWPEFEAAAMRLAGSDSRIFVTARGFGGGRADGEAVAIERCVALARRSGVAMHLLAVSHWGALDVIADAKAEGLPISASTELGVLSVASRHPIGRDRFAVALRDGTLDAITANDDEGDPIGSLLARVADGMCDRETAFELAASRPARLLGLPTGILQPGALAEILVLDDSVVGGALRSMILGTRMIAP